MLNADPQRCLPKSKAKPVLLEWALLVLIGALLGGIAYFVTNAVVLPSESVRLLGSGSSFAGPVWKTLMDNYQNDRPYLQSRYNTTSSGSALTSLVLGESAFGATDDPNLALGDDQPNYILPTFVGAVGIIYHLDPEAEDPLVLSMDLLLGIFNGSVTDWADSRILTLNPGLAPTLHALGHIAPYHRTTASGTTYLLADAFSSWSTEWKAKYGSHLNISWNFDQKIPIPENGDMITAVAATKGTIGYIGVSYDIDALQRERGIRFAKLKNRFGDDSLPSPANIQAVLSRVEWVDDNLRYDLVDFNCSNCWPIVGFTYAAVLQKYLPSPKYPAVQTCSSIFETLKFLNWVIQNDTAKNIIQGEQFFLPPVKVAQDVTEYLDDITCDGVNASIPPPRLRLDWILACIAGTIPIVVGLIRLFVAHRWCRTPKVDMVINDDDANGGIDVVEGQPLLPPNIEKKFNPRLNKALIGTDDLELIKPIGKGSFGEVYVGKWRGTVVAIKRMLIGDVDTVTSFIKEASLMSTLRHPNIVMFLGASIKQPHLYLVTELCGRGSLFDVIHTPNFELTPDRRKSMLIDAALGMMYLHSEDVIHRDFKTQNLMVTDDWTIKVGDFGTSRVLDPGKTMTQCGTVHYAAPEVFIHADKISAKSDVYSFGIVLWDLFSFPEELYPGMSVFEVMDGVVRRNLRPPMDRITNERIRSLMARCLSEDISLRPNFKEIVDYLRETPIAEFV